MSIQSDDLIHIVEEWQSVLSRLVDEVTTWVQNQPNWSVLPIAAKQITEEFLSSYAAPVLTIITPGGRLILEPMARNVFGGRGTVELYAWPTLRRVRLVRKINEEEWAILTDSGIKLRQPWNQETFVTLIQDLLGDE